MGLDNSNVTVTTSSAGQRTVTVGQPPVPPTSHYRPPSPTDSRSATHNMPKDNISMGSGTTFNIGSRSASTSTTPTIRYGSDGSKFVFNGPVDNWVGDCHDDVTVTMHGDGTSTTTFKKPAEQQQKHRPTNGKGSWANA